MLGALTARPRLAALLGAMCIAFSGIFYVAADVSPSTATVFRCLFGLPILVLVGLGERGRYGPLPRRTVGLAVVAGVFFAGDLLFWHHAIEAVGAGLATVLGNLQVLVVGVVAFLVFGERPSRATLIALGRLIDLQDLPPEGVQGMVGVCHSFQPEVVRGSSRMLASTRDYSERPQDLLLNIN